MSEVNIDAELIRSGQASMQRVVDKAEGEGGHTNKEGEGMVELSNGCICCTLREDLLTTLITMATPLAEQGASDGAAPASLPTLGKLLSKRRFDYVIIESSGISEPLPVAEAFTFADSDGRKLSDFCRLDCCVTVVDAFNFSRDYNSRTSLKDKGLETGSEDERHVVDLLIDQVEFANLIVLNKMDLFPKDNEEMTKEKDKLVATLRALNPSARIIEATRGNVDPSLILNTHLFSFEKASAAPGWLQELRGTHVPETLEYGISSFCFKAKRPFHPTRLYDLVYRSDKLSTVVRSKGFFWLGCDGGMDEVGIWAQAGKLFSFQAGRDWWASMTSDKWPEIVKKQLGEQACKSCEKDPLPAPSSPFPYRHDELTDAAAWDPYYGDRRQEIVVIGCGMDRSAVEAALRECLVTDEEYAAGPVGHHEAGCSNLKRAEERAARKKATAEDEDDEEDDDEGSVYPGDDGCLDGCVAGWDGYDDPFDFFEYAPEEGEEGDDDDDDEEDDHHGHGHGHSHGKSGHVHGPGCKH